MSPSLRWRHVTINAKNTWLPGDKRGFRDHDHRIHSSGNYKNPPPPEEHAGLRRYNEARAGDPVHFIAQVRKQILRSFVLKCRSLNHRIIAASLSDSHLHSLVELPDDYAWVKKEIGKCKQRASYDVRNRIAGQIWAEGGDYKRITDATHLHNVWRYIRERQERDAIIWSITREENWIDIPCIAPGAIVYGAPLAIEQTVT